MRLRRVLLAGGGAAAAALCGGVLGVVWASARPRPTGAGARPPEPPPLPPGSTVAVPGRGEFFLRDLPGPAPDAPTILLLHGWMYPADTNWFRCYRALARVGRVVAYDHRGHGRGTRPSTPFRLTDAADDAAALVRRLGTGPVVAVGYSMGGSIAQLLWRRHPDAVRGLVLCATSATYSLTVRDRLLWRGMGLLQLLLRVLPRHWWERALQRQVEGRLPFRLTRMIHDDTPPEVAALLPWFVAELARGSAEDLAEAGRQLGGYDARGWVAEIDVPTAVLVTTRDALVPVERQRDLAAAIPGALVHELACDHDAVIAAADTFVPTLARAVEQVLARGARPTAGTPRAADVAPPRARGQGADG